MNTFWIVIIDIIIALLGYYGAISLFSLLQFFLFTLPFTKFLAKNEVIEPLSKKQLLFVELISSMITFLIPNGLCVLLASFVKPSGYIVYAIAAFIGIFILHPTRDRYTNSPYCVDNYISRHSICLDVEKLKSVIAEPENAVQ